MNDDARELRELIARLSDGRLTGDEARRLNDLLLADPVAQEAYLDHLLIDGLLEREFAVVPFSRPAQVEQRLRPGDRGTGGGAAGGGGRRPRFGRSWLVAAGLLLGGAGWLWTLAGPAADASQPVALSDPGFEQATPVPHESAGAAAWFGDSAEVVERFAHIVPQEGGRMLRFVKSEEDPEQGCELYQLVELERVGGEFDLQTVALEASAFFNALPHDARPEDCVFGVTLFAYALDPSGHLREAHEPQWDALSFGGQQAPADGDAASWQQVTTRLPLPADVQFVVIQLSVKHKDPEAEGEFSAHFVDNVTLNLVSRD